MLFYMEVSWNNNRNAWRTMKNLPKAMLLIKAIVRGSLIVRLIYIGILISLEPG